jgi:hypothetical protein
MPLKKATSKSKKAIQKAVSSNIRELMKDNMKFGKARGAGGKPRSREQILAIAISKATGR